MILTATQIDLDIIIPSEVSQTNIIWNCLYVDSFRKRDTNELIHTKQNKPKDMENNLIVTKGEKQGE